MYGGKVDEEHVYAACPSIRLLRSTLDMGDSCVLVEEWWCRILPGVPLSEGVVYHVNSRRWSEIKGVEVVVCVVVRDKGCDIGAVVYVEYNNRVK